MAGPSDDGPEPNTPATGAPAIGGTPRVGDELTVSTSDISDADGLDDARFAYQWIRTDTDISGATGSTYMAVEADEGERLKVRVNFTDDAGNAEILTSAATDAVAARPEPLTASFEGMPAEHTGARFTFGLTFSEHFPLSFRTLRDKAFEVGGGAVRKANRRESGSNVGWTITVEPDGHGAVTIRLPETRDCDARGALCTRDGRSLSHSLSATVRGPVGIAVADAHVEEDDGAVLAFAVTLTRAASRALTVDYATSDGSAQAGVDYTAASGTLTFQAGESSKTIEVGVLDDAHDEGEETFTLSAVERVGRRGSTDAEATGTIKNTGPDAGVRCWPRFGRATAVAGSASTSRSGWQAPRERGFRAPVPPAGSFGRGMERDFALGFLSPARKRASGVGIRAAWPATDRWPARRRWTLRRWGRRGPAEAAR